MSETGTGRYVELHARSAFSFLRGASGPEKLIETCAKLALPAIGLCDRGGVYGAARLFQRGREHGVRAIVGAEVEMEDATVGPLLVATREGYRNLCALLTAGHLSGPTWGGRGRRGGNGGRNGAAAPRCDARGLPQPLRPAHGRPPRRAEGGGAGELVLSCGDERGGRPPLRGGGGGASAGV